MKWIHTNMILLPNWYCMYTQEKIIDEWFDDVSQSIVELTNETYVYSNVMNTY